jgi:hypothetical protein
VVEVVFATVDHSDIRRSQARRLRTRRFRHLCDQSKSTTEVYKLSLDDAFSLLTLATTCWLESLRFARKRGTFNTGMNVVNHARKTSNLIIGVAFLLGILVVGLVAFLA